MISKRSICKPLAILFCLGSVCSWKINNAVGMQSILVEAVKDYCQKNNLNTDNIGPGVVIPEVQLAQYEQGYYRSKWNLNVGTYKFTLIAPHNAYECEEFKRNIEEKFGEDEGVKQAINLLIRPVGHEYSYQINNARGLIYVKELEKERTMLDVMKDFISNPTSNFLATKQTYYKLGEALAELHFLGNFDATSMASTFASEKYADNINYDTNNGITFVNANCFSFSNSKPVELDIDSILNRVCFLPLLFFTNIPQDTKVNLVSVVKQFIIGYAKTMKENEQQAAVPAIKDMITKRLESNVQHNCWYTVIYLFPNEQHVIYSKINYEDTQHMQNLKEEALTYFSSLES